MPVPPRNMSSQLENTSAILGEYMMKGWTLTDLQCDTCHITPLMREPAAQASAANRTRIQFCAQCDGGPEGNGAAAPSVIPPVQPNPPQPSSSSSSHLLSSISNTPFPSTSASAARNRASEDISELISQRLLQGYSLLQINCPSPECSGVPLIGYPRAKDGSKDPRRMCVSCGKGYVSEGNMNGMRSMQDTLQGRSGYAGHSMSARSLDRPLDGEEGSHREAKEQLESPRSKKRRELYETGEAINKTLRPSEPIITTTTKAQSAIPEIDDEELHSPIEPISTSILPIQPSDPLNSALDKVSNSLALTLDRLASSLAAHTAGTDSSSEARYFIDVKLHTEALKDVLECVGTIRGMK